MVHVRKSTHLSITASIQYMLIGTANLVSIKEKGDCTAMFRFINDKSEQKYFSIFKFYIIMHLLLLQMHSKRNYQHCGVTQFSDRFDLLFK